jgi:hypothetical protein
MCTERNDTEIRAVHAIIHVTNQMYTYKLFRSVVLIKVVYVETSTFHPSCPHFPFCMVTPFSSSHFNEHSVSPL